MDEQRTDEWFAARLGKVTASRVADLMATTKSGYAASRENLMAQLIVEQLTGQKQESYSNASMQWGTEQEPFARAAYEIATGTMVDECGFVPHPTIDGSGASPDGLVGHDGLVEIKCPNTAGMIEALLTQTVPGKYNIQMQMQMACTSRQWCDYVVFDPRMPAKAQLFIKRVPRDPAFIQKMEAEIIKFLAELDGKVNQLKKQYDVKFAAREYSTSDGARKTYWSQHGSMWIDDNGSITIKMDSIPVGETWKGYLKAFPSKPREQQQQKTHYEGLPSDDFDDTPF